MQCLELAEVFAAMCDIFETVLSYYELSFNFVRLVWITYNTCSWLLSLELKLISFTNYWL